MHRASTLLLSSLFLGLAIASAQEVPTRETQYPAADSQPPAAAQPSDAQPASNAQPASDAQPADVAPPAAPLKAPAVARAYGDSKASNEVPDGYRFLVTLDEPIDTATVARGKHFKAMVREPIIAPSGQAITGGHWITGHVSEVQRGFNARLLLSFDEIQTSRGWIPLAATVVEVPSEHGLKPLGPEGEIERRPIDVRRTLEGAGVGAAIGASTGDAEGGGKAAAIGAASGAAAGAGVATLTDRNILLDKGAQLVLRLDRSILVP